MEVKKVFELSAGGVEYLLGDTGKYGFFYPANHLPDHMLYRDLSGETHIVECSNLDQAVSIYKNYLYSVNAIKKEFSHGGSRLGSGRKSKPPTKPVRLSLLEQNLIQEFRTSTIDKQRLTKMLIRLMADLENNER